MTKMVGTEIDFRKMTQEEFAKYFEFNLEQFAQERSKHSKRPIEEERATARDMITNLLKDGLNSKGHFLSKIVLRNAEQSVGHIWFHVDQAKKSAFLYDIMIEEQFRGRGYGKASLVLLEAKLLEMKVNQVGLHVFAKNEVALNLYKKQGYHAASYNMQKDL